MPPVGRFYVSVTEEARPPLRTGPGSLLQVPGAGVAVGEVGGMAKDRAGARRGGGSSCPVAAQKAEGGFEQV